MLGLFMGAMLGYNLAVLGLIFDCILPLIPFPSCFKGETLVLAYSQFQGINVMLLYGGLGVFGLGKDRTIVKLGKLCGSCGCGGRIIVPVGQKK